MTSKRHWAVSAVLTTLIAFSCTAVVPQATAGEAASPAFSGFYAGPGAAFSAGTASLSVAGARAGSLTLNGAALGGVVGYAHRQGNLVLGLEVDGAWSSSEDGVDTAVGRIELETRANLGAAAIVGGVIGEKVMVYGRAGYRAVVFEGTAPGTSFTDAARGPSIGAGVAVAITDRLILRAEGRNSFLGARRYSAGGVQLTVDPDEVAAGIGLLYRF